MSRFSILLTLFLFPSLWMTVVAQSVERPCGVVRFMKTLGTMIDSMTVRGVDSRYIEAPELPWQVILRGNINQSDLKLKSRVDGSTMFSNVVGDVLWEPHIKTDPSTYAGVWAGYRGYGFGYSWNVGGDKGRILTFGATGGSYGVNLRIHSFRNDEPEVFFAGNILFDDESPSQPVYVSNTEKEPLLSPIKTRTLLLDGYYLFNGKRFSYAAAYDQSVIQKRSAGSFMAGVMYYHSHINYAQDENAEFLLFMDNIGRIKQWQLSLGAGYSYNLVPCKGLLVSVMALPMVTVFDRHKTWRYESNLRDLALDEIDHDEDELPQEAWRLKAEPLSVNSSHSRIALNFDARLSVTYQWSRFFVNAYGQYCNFHYKDGDVKGVLTDWYINAAMGVRL